MNMHEETRAACFRSIATNCDIIRGQNKPPIRVVRRSITAGRAAVSSAVISQNLETGLGPAGVNGPGWW